MGQDVVNGKHNRLVPKFKNKTQTKENGRQGEAPTIGREGSMSCMLRLQLSIR